jgi:hypothetical protein
MIALRLAAIPSSENSVHLKSSSTKKQKLQDTFLDTTQWEEMLMGQREIVSQNNETKVLAMLQALCNRIQDDSRAKREILLGSITNDFHGLSGSCHMDVTQSKKMIMGLLEEENVIAEMIKDAIHDGSTNW